MLERDWWQRKEIMQKTVNETKPWFLENVNKSNKTLPRLIKKKREDSNY